ncbi:MAG TPA: hypothetical protein PLY87_30715, partial [Planctomycetaceae bacterium]|nr:hypothetical protein [Planctomycetaceae bacterium]
MCQPDKSAFVYDAEVTRDEHEEARKRPRERHRERMNTPDSADRYKQLQHFGEMPFAVMKVCFDLRRILLRGLACVQAEFDFVKRCQRVVNDRYDGPIIGLQQDRVNQRDAASERRISDCRTDCRECT